MNRRAFSLIETSIVILIIGILIAGITTSGQLVKNYKLGIVQNLTNNSPIGQTQGLVAWYETTSEFSFNATESSSGSLLSNWYDRNTQSGVRLQATQSTSANKPFYYTDDLLGFPLVGFATNDFFNLPDGTIPYGNSAYTFFIVAKVAADCACGILTAGTAATDSMNAISYVVGGNLNNYWWGDDVTTTNTPMSPVSNFHVITVMYDRTIGRKIYINGTLATTSGTPSSTALNIGSTNNAIGYSGGVNYYLLNGKIGEVAIFSRSLKDADRNDIEKYLGNKFKIVVASS